MNNKKQNFLKNSILFVSTIVYTAIGFALAILVGKLLVVVVSYLDMFLK